MGPDRTRRLAAIRLNYLGLLARLDNWFAYGVRVALPVVVPCRAGCSACCHGPFDISPADALLVAETVQALPTDIAAGIRDRARDQLDRGHAAVPAWHAPWHADDADEATFDAMCDALADAPCPALDPASQRCLIHAGRPATCRLMGLAIGTPDGDTLENLCPIQGGFPEYRQLEPIPLDLMAFEVDAAHHDLVAMASGWHSTTIAGAVVTTKDPRPS
jgi:Fe-S-cluster containining protein